MIINDNTETMIFKVPFLYLIKIENHEIVNCHRYMGI